MAVHPPRFQLGDPASLGWEAWLAAAAAFLAELAGASGATLWLFDEQAEALRVVGSAGMTEEYVAYAQQSALLAIAKERAPVYRAYRHGEWTDAPAPAVTEHVGIFGDFLDMPIAWIVAGPLGLSDTRVGAFALYYPPREPSEAPEAPRAADELTRLRLEARAVEIAGRVLQHRADAALALQLGEMEQANSYLNHAVMTLKELDHLKSNFISALSHELRTPLTAIMGYGEFLDDGTVGELSPEQRVFLGRIRENSQRLLQLVDDLLDYVVLEAGAFELSPQEGDLAGVAVEAVGRFATQAEKRGVTLAIEAPTAGLRGVFDPMRVSQVLGNLLSNALKFTARGGRVLVRLSETSEQGLRVEVEDTGIGIASRHLPHLFRRFTQLDMSATRRAGGVGLGLAIAKSLVTAHGGRIGVESALEEGSTFWFILPSEGEAPRPAPASAGPQ